SGDRSRRASARERPNWLKSRPLFDIVKLTSAVNETSKRATATGPLATGRIRSNPPGTCERPLFRGFTAAASLKRHDGGSPYTYDGDLFRGFTAAASLKRVHQNFLYDCTGDSSAALLPRPH